MFCALLDLATPPRRVALDTVARAFSPRVDVSGTDAGIVFSVSGLDRIIGAPPAIAAEIETLAVAHALTPRLAIAGSMTAAWLLASGRQHTRTVVPAGEEARTLSDLRLGVLAAPGPWARGLGPAYVGACLTTFLRWGLHTLGDLARLAEADVRTRLGDVGVRLHQAARGLDVAPLVPAGDPPRFHERMELEWPIEGLEPLSFVLSRLCESLAEALERADRGAVRVTTRLRLVTRATHERVLNLPAPMRDPRVLRTLLLLDLESHGPDAAIDIVEIDLDVTPGRIVRGSLLTRALPSTEALTTLVARLRALMGESRVGAPKLVDTHDERIVAMGEFLEQGTRHKTQGTRHKTQGTRDKTQGRSAEGEPAARSVLVSCDLVSCDLVSCDLVSSLVSCNLRLVPCVRRYRLPIAVSMELEQGAPVRVRSTSREVAGGRVINRAGPWRSSGRWWDTSRWDRDHWEIELGDGVYRIARDRVVGRWEIEGVLD